MLWIVALMNSFNFIDGMDGLAAGIGAITASTFAILALSLNRGGAALLAAALAGACLGFLRHNFHPARVFMGDAGSLTLGYLLAVIAIQGVLKTAAAVALLFPMLVLLVPIFDTSFVVLHRIKYGRRPWSADANHLHHRFVRVGFGQRRAALALYAWCGLLAGCALALRFLPWHTHNQVHWGATIVLGAAGAGGARRDRLDRDRARGRQAAASAAVRAGAPRRPPRGHAGDRGLAPSPGGGGGQALSADAARAVAVRAALELDRARHAAGPRLRPGGLRDGAGPGRERRPARAGRVRLARRPRSSWQPPGSGSSSPTEAPQLDLALDGADEVMRSLAVMKGGGGSLLREKIVIESAERFVVVAETRKIVTYLGERWRLPVEVVRFGWSGTRDRLLAVLDDAVLRSSASGTPFVTDEGHHILDCALPGGADLAFIAAARQVHDRRGRARALPDARRRWRCWARPTARSCDWSGRELHGAARLDERADQLRDDADVLGVVGVGLEALDIVELGGERKAGVAIAQCEVSTDRHRPHLGELRGERIDGLADALDLVGRSVGLELEGDDMMQHAATVAVAGRGRAPRRTSTHPHTPGGRRRIGLRARFLGSRTRSVRLSRTRGGICYVPRACGVVAHPGAGRREWAAGSVSTPGRQGSTSMRPQRPGAPDASGLAAGYLLLVTILGCAALGALVGWPLGIPIPLALAGAALGIVLGFYLVWVRWFRRR